MNYHSRPIDELITELEELKRENTDLKVFSNDIVISGKKPEIGFNEINRRVRDVQSVARVGSWETDLSSLEVKWSEETFRIFELDPLSFHPSHPKFLEFVHPDDRERVEKAFMESFLNHSINTSKHRIFTAKGTLKFLWIKAGVTFT